jgi:hypothetical protein
VLSGISEQDTAAQAKAALTSAYESFVAARKVAIGDDGRTLMMAAAAVDLAIEFLSPPAPDLALAAGSCKEAQGLVDQTRAYAPGGSIAIVVDPGKRKLEEALALLA